MSWIEQRSFLLNSLHFLQTGPYLTLHKNILAEWQSLANIHKPDLSGYTNLQHHPLSLALNGWSISTDLNTGAINHLSHKGVVWADSQHMLGYYQYKTYDNNDYNQFFSLYAYAQSYWIARDFGKFNVSEARPLHATYNATRTQCFYKTINNEILDIWTELTLPALTQTYYGAPKTIWVNIRLDTVKKPSVHFEVLLFNKTTTRLPETHFFSFNPLTNGKGGNWMMSILGSEVDPLNVVKNGSHHLHGVDEGGVMFGRGKEVGVSIRSVDTAVVNVGEPTGFPTPFTSPDLSKGWSYHLFNNLWGTNYVMWYPFYKGDENIRYRFEVDF